MRTDFNGVTGRGMSALIEREIERLGLLPVRGNGLWVNDDTARADSQGYAEFESQLGYTLAIDERTLTSVDEKTHDLVPERADFELLGDPVILAVPNFDARRNLAVRGLELTSSLRLASLSIALAGVYSSGAWTDPARGFGVEEIEDELFWLNVVNAWAHLGMGSDRWHDLWVVDVLGKTRESMKKESTTVANQAPKEERSGYAYRYAFNCYPPPEPLASAHADAYAEVCEIARGLAPHRVKRNVLIHKYVGREQMVISGQYDWKAVSADATELIRELADAYAQLRRGGELTFQMLLTRLLCEGVP